MPTHAVTQSSVDISLYLPSLRGGGAERAMLTLANGFSARGLRVDLVLAAAEGPYLAEVAPTVRVVDLGARRVATSLPGLVRYLRRECPTAMLSALNHANVIAVVARDLARVRTRLLVSERAHLSRSLAQAGSPAERLLVPLMKWAYRRADGIVAVSDGVADDLAQALGLPRSRIDVVYNPVVTPALKVLASAPVDHPWLGQREVPVILAVGRLAEQKDYPTLIRAFAQVRAQRDCRLIILGEGKLRKPLETLVAELKIGDSVQLPGFVDNPFAWMSRVSLFVLSSAWEGLPNVLIQAMACGVPVVSTDCPSGPNEILEGGKWGDLVPVRDSDALANAIMKHLVCPSQKNVRERSAFFGLDAALSGYLQLMSIQSGGTGQGEIEPSSPSQPRPSVLGEPSKYTSCT